jgi:pyruvate-ferredoxin/flavodoxin oxidoreductase
MLWPSPQAYFAYDAHKSGGVTISHLRFGPEPIGSSYQIEEADYLAVHHASYILK